MFMSAAAAMTWVCLSFSSTTEVLTVRSFSFVGQVRKTQNAIKHALTERFYAWEDAVELAKQDPEIQFTNKGRRVKYTPFEEDWEQEPQYMDAEGEDMLVEGEDARGLKENQKVDHEAVDPSIPHGSGKTQQDGPRSY